MRDRPDGFEWRNVYLSSLITDAYGVMFDNQISGLPDWARLEAYDIEAKVDAETAERWKKLTRKERGIEEQPLMRSILEDRCEFKAHEETRERPIYDLFIAKGGLRMREAAPNEETTETMTAGRVVTLTARATPVNSIIFAFAGPVGRVTVDRTGLGERKFDFDLSWTPDDLRTANGLADNAPSIFTALEEQLGLKLASSKGPVSIVVIDHMERPSPN